MNMLSNIIQLLKYYKHIKHETLYASRYSDELNMHNISNMINFYRDPKEQNETYNKCMQNMQNIQEYDKYIDIDKKYKVIKQLGGGKSGAYVFLVKDANKKYVLKLYALRLKDPKSLVDRDLREIFISCNLSNTEGFPKVIDYGYTYYSRNSKFWEPFVNTLCPSKNINFGLYTKCYFLVTDFVKGESLDKLNLINMSPKKLIHILYTLKQLFIKASEKIPNFIHQDLHPGNVIVDDEKVTIIDFDIANSLYYKYNLDSFRNTTGYILPQEAIINMLINYIGITKSFLIIELTEPTSIIVNPDFRIFLIYKILFEIIILYKITYKIDTSENLAINPDNDICNIIISKYMKNKNNCSSFTNCDDEYFNYLNLSEVDFIDTINKYFSKYKAETLDINFVKLSSVLIDKMFLQIENNCQKCKNLELSKNFKKTKISEYIHEFIVSFEELTKEYYNKTGKYMRPSDCIIELLFNFKNIEIPIHTNDYSFNLFINSNDDGLLIELTNSTITLINKNTDIKIGGLFQQFNFNSVVDKIITSVINNIERLEYNYKKKTIKIKSKNNISLTKILEKYSNSEKGIKKIHMYLERLECNKPMDILELFTNLGFDIIPFIIFIFQKIPTGSITIKSKYNDSISKKINMKLSYELINKILHDFDLLVYKHYEDIKNIVSDYQKEIKNNIKQLIGGNKIINDNFYNEDPNVVDLMKYINDNVVNMINNTNTNINTNKLNKIKQDKLKEILNTFSKTLKVNEFFDTYELLLQDTNYYNNYFYDLFNKIYGQTISYKKAYIQTEIIYNSLNVKDKNNNYKYKFINEEHTRYLKRLFTDIIKNKPSSFKSNIKNIINSENDDYGKLIMEYADSYLYRK